MNERIKEIWEKAAESTAAYPSGQNNSWETQVNFMEKFAELIVQECAGVCAGIAAVRAGYNDVDGRDTAYSCGDTIKEYFGVE